jgi:hypothetical protein
MRRIRSRSPLRSSRWWRRRPPPTDAAGRVSPLWFLCSNCGFPTVKILDDTVKFLKKDGLVLYSEIGFTLHSFYSSSVQFSSVSSFSD